MLVQKSHQVTEMELPTEQLQLAENEENITDYDLWETEEEKEALLAKLEQGRADIKAGLGIDAREFMAELMKKYEL